MLLEGWTEVNQYLPICKDCSCREGRKLIKTQTIPTLYDCESSSLGLLFFLSTDLDLLHLSNLEILFDIYTHTLFIWNQCFLADHWNKCVYMLKAFILVDSGSMGSFTGTRVAAQLQSKILFSESQFDIADGRPMICNQRISHLLWWIHSYHSSVNFCRPLSLRWPTLKVQTPPRSRPLKNYWLLLLRVY